MPWRAFKSNTRDGPTGWWPFGASIRPVCGKRPCCGFGHPWAHQAKWHWSLRPTLILRTCRPGCFPSTGGYTKAPEEPSRRSSAPPSQLGGGHALVADRWQGRTGQVAVELDAGTVTIDLTTRDPWKHSWRTCNDFTSRTWSGRLPWQRGSIVPGAFAFRVGRAPRLV